MNNCGCKRPAFGPEPHAPVPLHGGGFVPNAIEWLKKKIDKLFGTAVFTVNGKAPTAGSVKIVLDDLADKDGNIETSKKIMVSRDGGESHDAVALYPDLISEIDAHNNDVRAHTKLMTIIANGFATKTEVEKKYDKTGGAITGDVSISGSLSLTGSTPKITANQKDFSFPTESGKLARAEDYYTTAEVDNKITTFVAHYLTGKDSAGRFVPFATRAALDYAKQHHTDGDPQFFYAGEPFTPTKNDYCVVLADETVGGKTARYSFVGEWPTGSWQYQYTINDTAFSEAQWAAINSGVTSAWMENTLSALQAEVNRAQTAETQLTTKAENAQSAANAAQSAANAASDKADELDAAKADKSALTAHVENTNNPHGVTAAQVGAVSISRSPDSDQTFDWSPSGVDSNIRLFGTFYKTGIGLGLWSGGGSLFNYHDDTSDTYQFPAGKSGTFALTSDIADAVKGKVGSFESVGGASATVENGVAKLSAFFTESNSLLTGTIDAEVISKGTAPDAHLEAPTDEHLKLILADNSVAYDSAKALPYKLTSVIGDRVIATMTLTAASTDITLPTIAANDTTVKDFILDVTNAYAVEGVATDAGINIPRTDFKLVTRDGESLTAVTTVKAGKSAFICFTQKSPVVVDGTTYPCWCVIQLPFGDPS